MAASIDSRDKFNNLYYKFLSLNYEGDEKHKQHLNIVLDELNSFDYKTFIIPDYNYGSQLINYCVHQVPQDDAFLAAKASRLIVNLVTKQRISLNQDIIEPSLCWFLGALNTCSDIVICDLLEGLAVVLKGNAKSIEKYHGILVESEGVLPKLLNNKKSLAERNTSSPYDINLLVLKCLENFVCTNEENVTKSNNETWISENHLDNCGNLFLKYLYTPKAKQQDEQNYCKILASCLSGCRYIALHPTLWCNNKLGDILGAARIHMLRGIPGYEDVIPQKVLPSQQPIPEASNNSSRIGRGGKVAKVRKQRSFISKKSVGASGDGEKHTNKSYYNMEMNISATMSAPLQGWIKTSDSDFSDTEAGQAARDRLMQGRARQSALDLLLTVNKIISRRDMFGYWHSLMPSGPTASSRSLSSCVLGDPSPKGRIAALAVITSMLTGSREYLSQAESSDKTPTAYTPFSVVVGGMITALHNTLVLALSGESSLPVLTHMLKCFSILVQVAPYHRLEPGLIGKLVRSVKGFTRHRDTAVQVAALVVLGCVVSIEPSTSEIEDILSKPLHSQRYHKAVRTYSKNTLEFIKKNISPTNNPLNKLDNSVGDACLNVMKPEVDSLCLQSTSRQSCDDEDYDVDEDFNDLSVNESDCNISLGSDNKLSWLLETCLGNLGINKDPAPAPVRIESLHVLSSIGGSYFKSIATHLDAVSLALGSALIDQYTEIKLHAGRCLDIIGHAMNMHLTEKENIKLASSAQCAIFWQSLMTPLWELARDYHNPSLRAISCDCFGNIGAEVFEVLPRDKQIFVITTLFGSAKDDESTVRAAAVRALAVCVIFPSLREDSGFVMDTAESILTLMKETNLQVRIKASWSLGNLSDALVTNSNNPDCEDIPNFMLINLIKTSTIAAKDNDKVRCNAMRAVGNLLRIIKVELLNQLECKDAVNEAVDKLVNITGTMKVRWNACYALGNVLRNMELFQGSSGQIRQNSVFAALNDLVINSRNFKVRINAAMSLSVPQKRTDYGVHFNRVWGSLINALDNTSNIEDFNEYKHRDNLVDQICLSLAHLSTICKVEDLCNMQDTLIPHLDLVRQDVCRVSGRLLPEKVSSFLAAGAHLKILEASQITQEQSTAIKCISSVFNQGSYDYDCY